MMNSIKAINEAIDNHDQRGIELDWPQQKALLYNFRALIESKDRDLDERAAEAAATIERCREIDQAVLAALKKIALDHPFQIITASAPPIASVEAAVKAVEGLVKALEEQRCWFCENSIGWQGEFDAEQRRLGRRDWRTCSQCRDARAALAAWKEATRG